jgi:hypothetical protein
MVVCGSIVAVARGLPMLHEWEAERLSVAAEAEQQLALASSSAGMARAVEAGAVRARAREASVDSTVIDAQTPAQAGAELALLLSDRADSTGVAITSEGVRADTGFTRGFARTRVRLSASGDVRALMSFLARIESGPQLIAVRDFAVAQSDPAAGDERAESLRFELLVEALVRRSANTKSAP